MKPEGKVLEPDKEDVRQFFDTILYSFVYLDRNLKGEKFTFHASDAEKAKIADSIASRMRSLGYSLAKVSELDNNVKIVLAEKSFYSKHYLMNDNNYIVLSPKERVWIVINDESHVSIRSLIPGLDLLALWNCVNDADNIMEKHLAWAFEPGLGYLQAELAASGNGITAGFRAHTPALLMSGLADSAFKRVIESGFIVNGRYSADGSSAMFDISLPKGNREPEAKSLSKLTEMARLVREYEKSALEQLLKRSPWDIVDYIGRAFGRAAYARLISRDEAAEIISGLRFGIASGILEGSNLGAISKLWQELEIDTQGFINNSEAKDVSYTKAIVPEASVRAQKLSSAINGLHFRKGF